MASSSSLGASDVAVPAALPFRAESFDLVVIWTVPGFTVERCWDRLADLHRRITAEGPFVAHSKRFLIEARKPA